MGGSRPAYYFCVRNMTSDTQRRAVNCYITTIVLNRVTAIPSGILAVSLGFVDPTRRGSGSSGVVSLPRQSQSPYNFFLSCCIGEDLAHDNRTHFHETINRAINVFHVCMHSYMYIIKVT